MRSLRCLLGSHKYYKMFRVSQAADMIGCERCSRRWAMNHMCNAFLPWDSVAELYEGPRAVFPESGWLRYEKRAP